MPSSPKLFLYTEPRDHNQNHENRLSLQVLATASINQALTEVFVRSVERDRDILHPSSQAISQAVKTFSKFLAGIRKARAGYMKPVTFTTGDAGGVASRILNRNSQQYISARLLLASFFTIA
jgi:hypothetical protein